MNRDDQQQDLVLNAFEQVEVACREFRQGWKEGKPDKIENVLGQFEETAHLNVFRNLLNIEIEFRRRAKQNPTSEEYIKRFPQFARLIRQAFFMSTMMSMQSLHSTPGEGLGEPSLDVTQSFEMPAANQLGDFQLLQELGRGGFGVVYEARHQGRGDRVALKTLPIDDRPVVDKRSDEASRHRKQQAGDRLVRFKREFRALADINHPNLVGLHSLEKDGNTWFFTMDLVDGTDFLDYVRPDDELDVERLNSVLPQFIAGVLALHNRNIIHRDLKPHNVMVTNNGQVVILDFGLVAELQQRSDQTASQISKHFAGTPAYAAPEQLAGEHTGASDWYAVGVMLYEALAGQRPFEGGGIEVLNAKRREDAPPLPPDDDAIPKEIAGLTMRLLARQADQRPDALAITEVVSGVAATETIRSTDSLAKSGSLIGRESHLKMLQDAFEAMKRDQSAQCVFVSGRSGEGKTSLVEHFLEPIRRDRDFVVLSGRCYDRESVPFKALDGMIDSLGVYLQRLPEADVARMLPDDLAFLVQLFPSLQRVEAIAKTKLPSVAQMDRIQVQHRGFMALRLLLTRLSSHKPVVIFTDDLQWGDADSAEGLSKVLRDPDSPCVLYIGTYRSDEIEDSPFDQRWQELVDRESAGMTWETVSLAPLNVEECTQLVIQELDRDDALIRRRAKEIAVKTGGNPYLLIELTGCFDPESDSFEVFSLPEVVKRKLARLPEEAMSLMYMIAIANQAVPLSVATKAARYSEVAIGTVAQLRKENLLRMVGNESLVLVDTYHDKIRETLLDLLNSEQLPNMHLAMAKAIEEIEGIDASLIQSIVSNAASSLDNSINRNSGELARHYAAAGDAKSTVAYSLLAAEYAVQSSAHDLAIEHFERAEDYLTTEPSTVRYRITAGWARSLVQLGQYQQALGRYHQAESYAISRIDIAGVKSACAEIRQKCGHFEQSYREYIELLAELRVHVPSTRIGKVISICSNFCRDKINRLPPFRRSRRVDDVCQFAHQTLVDLKFVAPWRDSLSDLWIMFYLIEKGSRYDDRMTTAFADAMASLWQLYRSDYTRGWANYQQCINQFMKLDNASNYLSALRAAGYLQIWNGRFREAIETLRQTEKIATVKTPEFYSLYVARVWISIAMFPLGQLTAAAELSQKTFATLAESGHARMASLALAVWTRSTNGKLPFDRLRSCIGSLDETPTAFCQLLAAESLWHLAQGKPRKGYLAASHALRVVRERLLANGFTTIVFPAFVRAARIYASELLGNTPTEARRVRREAIRVGKWGCWLARWIQTDAASTHREFSLALNQFGRKRKALKYARRSCEIAEQQGAMYELAQSRMVVAELSQKLGLPDTDRLLEEAREELAPFEAMIEANAAMFTSST